MYQPTCDLKPYFLTIDDLGAVIDWREFFGNENPVELDIGCGRGLYLVNAGMARPETNFLGIELDYKEGRRGALRLQKREMPNARVLGGDVRLVLDRHIPPGSVSAAHVYFPDPWWKKKHKKRLLFTDCFADQLADVLRPSGVVHSWTDVEEYFQVISALMDHHPQFTTLIPQKQRKPTHDMDYQTSFERKKRQAGQTIYRGCWQRQHDGTP